MEVQKIYGYMRVSTKEQNEERQRTALLEVGVPKQQIYMDKQSGKDFDRTEYQKLLQKLDSSSVLFVKSIDRLGTFISDIVLALLSYVAENERINIRQRQAEGIAAAKARGVKFGRPPLPLPPNFYEVRKQWREKKLTLRQAADACNMAESTFIDKVRVYEKCLANLDKKLV